MRSDDLPRRVAAAQATMDRFRDKPFRWGTADCARLTAWHLRQLGAKVSLARAGSYKSALGAKRALGRLGVSHMRELPELFGLVAVAPAAAIVGDIVEVEAEDTLGALGVALGNGRVLGYHQDASGAVVVQPLALLAAWRCV